MSFRWLPDAELDPHPRLTWLIEYCFDLAISRLYRIDVHYPPGYRLAPGTLVVSNHRRDVDVPILASVLCRRQGLRLDQPLPFFASREDLFRRDFLSEYLHAWPRPLQRLLGRIPLAWFFHAMRVKPIRRVREFSLSEAFSELPDPGEKVHWLNARGRHEWATGERNNPGRPGKPPNRRAWGLRRLHGKARRTLQPDFRATIITQLEHFAGLLDAGRIVYLAPEGANSRDGRFHRLRAGTWELVQRAAQAPPILPLALSYDALRAGRLRPIVRVGTPLAAYPVHDRGHFDTMLKIQIRKLFPLNTSHLISRFLVWGPATFTTHDFADWLERARDQLAQTDSVVDPELAHCDTHTLAATRLDWLRHSALVSRTQSGWRNDWPQHSEPGWRTPAETVRYCENALDDHLRALAPNLLLRP